jgi:hypothetical protein
VSPIYQGQKFGYLTTIERSGRKWLCECICGNRKFIASANLAYGEKPTKSCGCMHIELIRKARTIHGMSIKSDTDEYRTFVAWQAMIWRCTNKNRKDYQRYGGRGIRVCDRWSEFSNFISDMGLKKNGTSLGRIDNDGNYCPENCKWESPTQQARNKVTSHNITFQGKTQTIIAWAEELGISKSALWHRIAKGWSPERALTQRPRKQKNSSCNWVGPALC